MTNTELVQRCIARGLCGYAEPPKPDAGVTVRGTTRKQVHVRHANGWLADLRAKHAANIAAGLRFDGKPRARKLRANYKSNER